MISDQEILDMFSAIGMRIESGAQFSAVGQIAQLLDVVKPLIEGSHKLEREKQDLSC